MSRVREKQTPTVAQAHPEPDSLVKGAVIESRELVEPIDLTLNDGDTTLAQALADADAVQARHINITLAARRLCDDWGSFADNRAHMDARITELREALAS